MEGRDEVGVVQGGGAGGVVGCESGGGVGEVEVVGSVVR